MEIYYGFSSVLSLIALICFFVLGDNVGKIRRTILDDRLKDARIRYRIGLATKNDEEAYKALLYILYYQLAQPKADWEKKEKYDALRVEFEPLLEALGHKYPDQI